MASISDFSTPYSPSVMALTGSRAPSPSDLTITEIQELESKETRHSQFYFEDGNIVFQVEDTLYNVHRYFFARDSTHFRAIFQGLAGTDACVLPDVTCTDFDEFLAILYPTNFRRPTEKTTAQWTSILHLAAKWGFENIKLLAFDNLAASATPIDKIVLGRRYGFVDWLPEAYQAVCTRADPLTVEEGMKLGIEDTVRISAARQVYGIGQARFEPKHLAGDLANIFKLGGPSDSVPSMDSEEETIKVLEQQIAEARVVTKPTAYCQEPTYFYVDNLDVHVPERCGSCEPCRELYQHKETREAKEEKQRQLTDLKAGIKNRQQELVGRQERMSLSR